MAKNLFFIGIIISASGMISPPIALALGIVFGFSFAHPYASDAQKLSKMLLQCSVVGLGFGMDLEQVLRAGRSGFVYTALSITAVLTVGLLLGRVFRVDGQASLLISSGTAICGGSAIAAIAPIIEATDGAIAISLGTVFVLNSIALFLFPFIGTAGQTHHSRYMPV